MKKFSIRRIKPRYFRFSIYDLRLRKTTETREAKRMKDEGGRMNFIPHPSSFIPSPCLRVSVFSPIWKSKIKNQKSKIVCALCLSLLFASSLYCDNTVANILISMKVSLVQSDSSPDSADAWVDRLMLMVEIKGTQPVKYKTAFLNATAKKPQRFYIDIEKSYKKIKTIESLPMPLSKLLELPSFPISKIVVAQHALMPPITRVVFYLRRQIDIIPEAQGDLLAIKIPNLPELLTSRESIPEYDEVSHPTPVADNSVVERNDTISLDAKDADIRDVLTGLARANGINLIMDDSVQGNLTVSLSNVSPIEAIELTLRNNGFAVERTESAIVAATPEELKSILPMVSEIITLQYASAPDLKQSLTGLADSSKADIQADARTNSLIITGIESDVQKLGRIIELLDVEVPPKPQVSTVIKVFPLKYAQASVIQALVSELCSPVGKVRVDDRTNSLIVTDEIAVIERLEEVIAKLDVQSPFDRKDREAADELYTRVFKLNYIDANALKDTIQEMLSPNGKVRAFVQQKESIIPIQTRGIGISTVTTTERGAEAGTAEYGGTYPDARRLAEQKWSDALIVTDRASIIERIDELIKKLDIQTPQVMIEARMVELSLRDAENLGINWRIGHSPSKSTLGTEYTTNDTNGITLQIGTLSTQHFEDIMFKIQALETSGQARLISNPSVITLDNELAQMVVADRIPIPSRYQTQLGVTTSYDYMNVGIMLKVIPHIAEDGYILMDAMPEVNSIKEWTTGEDRQPIVSSRMAHSRVRVKDGQTFVVGGLIKDERRETMSGVPLLRRIPLLGRLFRTEGVDNAKTDLVVFITPRICKEDSQTGIKE